MDRVVATVSGYHGSERFNLIKLISQTGASYVGAMTKSTTHLVCWNHDGRKYRLAKKFKIAIVNHRWIVDCIKAGKRIPEDPYILVSGEEVGPIDLEVQFLAKEIVPLQKDKVRSCQSKEGNLSEESLIVLDCKTTRHSIWIDSCLSKENIYPDAQTSKNGSPRVKNKRVGRSLKQDCQSSDRYTAQELPLSELVRVERHGDSGFYLREHLVKQKRNICDLIQGTSSLTPSRNGQRLVKRSKSKGILSSAVADSEQGRSPDNVIASENVSRENVSGFLGTTSNERCVERGEAEEKNGGELEDITRPPHSIELSCVICWTEFCSIRGILPCGHRFCYSCIESWANHMALRGKVSACPLCKANFLSIIKVDDDLCLEQKIYSQTIPDAPLESDVLVPSSGAQWAGVGVCCECCRREPVDLLVWCRLCGSGCVHSYCLDPPLFPWTCSRCREHATIH